MKKEFIEDIKRTLRFSSRYISGPATQLLGAFFIFEGYTSEPANENLALMGMGVFLAGTAIDTLIKYAVD